MTTSPDSRIYFQNIRSAFYVREEPAQGLVLFTHRQFDRDTTRPGVRVLIADRYIDDAAYLFVQGTGPCRDLPLTLHWQDSLGQRSDSLIFSGAGMDIHWTTATRLYFGIKRGHRWRWRAPDGTWYGLLEGRDRKALLKTMRDYYELVNLR